MILAFLLTGFATVFAMPYEATAVVVGTNASNPSSPALDMPVFGESTYNQKMNRTELPWHVRAALQDVYEFYNRAALTPFRATQAADLRLILLQIASNVTTAGSQVTIEPFVAAKSLPDYIIRDVLLGPFDNSTVETLAWGNVTEEAMIDDSSTLESELAAQFLDGVTTPTNITSDASAPSSPPAVFASIAAAATVRASV